MIKSLLQIRKVNFLIHFYFWMNDIKAVIICIKCIQKKKIINLKNINAK